MSTTLQAKSAESRQEQAVNHDITMAACTGSRYVNIFEDGKRIFSGDSKLIRFVLDNPEAVEMALDGIEDDITEAAELGKAAEVMLNSMGIKKSSNPVAFAKAKAEILGKNKTPIAADPAKVKMLEERAKKMKDFFSNLEMN